ncbi:hypothetical protein D918_08226 [Trichuris suis]|nr:hypothetical protein M513_06834 [Trichuris suis]KHJ41696.1 hypothetical protein D918_08226 [Trichuris suis]
MAYRTSIVRRRMDSWQSHTPVSPVADLPLNLLEKKAICDRLIMCRLPRRSAPGFVVNGDCKNKDTNGFEAPAKRQATMNAMKSNERPGTSTEQCGLTSADLDELLNIQHELMRIKDMVYDVRESYDALLEKVKLHQRDQ